MIICTTGIGDSMLVHLLGQSHTAQIFEIQKQASLIDNHKHALDKFLKYGGYITNGTWQGTFDGQSYWWVAVDVSLQCTYDINGKFRLNTHCNLCGVKLGDGQDSPCCLCDIEFNRA